jgi:thiol-disulfide isomerase/thioredoxin
MKPLNRIALILISLSYSLPVFAVDYVVRGKIDNADGKYVYAFDYDRKAVIDSAKVSDGQFEMAGHYDNNAFVLVRCERAYANVILDTLAVADFETHLPAVGTELNMRAQKFMSRDMYIHDDLAKLTQKLKSQGVDENEFKAAYHQLYDTYRPEMLELYRSTIKNNPNGLGVAAIMSLKGLMDLTADEWNDTYVLFPEELKAIRIAQELCDKFEMINASKVGMPMIDFEAKTVDGDVVKLSDYVGKGKYVLLDFWGKSCGPCLEEAEQVLTPLYQETKDDAKFEIISVNIWDTAESALKFLSSHPYPWRQLIGAGREPMRLYGFDYLPMIILFSPEGTILARELRGNGLIKTVKSYLTK